jgi:hypothetical protein
VACSLDEHIKKNLSPCSAELISTAYQPWNDVFLSQQNSHSRLISQKNSLPNRAYKYNYIKNIGPVHSAYNPSFSTCFFSRNNIFLSQQISQQCFSAGLSAQPNGSIKSVSCFF